VLFNGRDNIALKGTFNPPELGLDALRVVPMSGAPYRGRVKPVRINHTSR